MTSEEKVYFAKYSYTLGDGAKYYSVYYKDKGGKEVWAGYTNASNVKELKATEETKFVTLKKDYNTWNNLYFKEHKDDFKAEKGVNFKVKRYYTLNGNKFYSTYRTNAEGEEVWTGYVNGYSSVVEDLKADKVADKDQKVQVVKDYNTYKNHFFNKNGQLSKDKILTMKVTYTYGNGKKYASLYDGDKWLGYANIDAVKSASTLLNNANKAIEDAKKQLDGKTADSQKAVNDAIKALEDAMKANDGKQIADKVNALNDAVKKLQPVASNEDVNKLDEAIEKGENYVGSADTTTDRKALDDAVAKAKKVKEAADKNNATKEDVDNAIKGIEDAINGIKPGETSANKEEIQKLQAAIDLLEQINKIGADKLENDGNYDTVLQGAKDVVKAAEAGKATQKQIDAAVKSVEDFINGLRLNNSDLEKLVNNIKESASKVYLTKDQEEQIDKFVQEAEKAVKDTQLSNVDKLKTINENAEKAKNFIAGQPTENDVKDLMDAIKQEQNIEEKANGKESEVFDGWNNVTTKDAAADTMLENIKKDDKDGENTADKKYTAKEVQNTAGELKQAIGALTVNKDNTTKFYNAAKKSIGELDGTNKEEAEKLLQRFKDQLQSDHSINNIDAIVAVAKELAADIEKDQKQELDDAIAKAKRIEGEGQQYKKYYENTSYEKMNKDLQAAETAEAKLDGELPSKATKTVPAEVTNGQAAEKAEKDLEQAITDLKVKDFEVKEDEKSNTIELDKYTGNFNPAKQKSRVRQEAGQNVVEIPAMLKDKQVVIAEQKESSDDTKLFSQYTNTDAQAGKWTVKFVEQDGKKVKAADNMISAFSKNKPFGKMDLTGLDFSNTTNMRSMFNNDFYLSEFENNSLNTIVSDKVTTINGMLCNTNINTVDVSKWDVSNVTDMQRLFKRSKVQTINMSGWKLNDSVKLGSDDNNMFNGANKLSELTLPTDKTSAEKIANELKDAKLSQNITLKHNGEKVGTCQSGKLQSKEESQESETITTNPTVLNDGAKLSRAILESPKSNDASKELAKVVEAAYKVDENSTGNDEKSIAGLENNRAWTEFGGQGNGTYYDAIKDLQDYARKTSSVKDATLTSAKDELVDDMEGLRVTPVELKDAMDAAEKATSQTKSSDSESTEDLIEQAKVIVYSKTDARRGLDNWKNINELIAKLKAVVKK